MALAVALMDFKSSMGSSADDETADAVKGFHLSRKSFAMVILFLALDCIILHRMIGRHNTGKTVKVLLRVRQEREKRELHTELSHHG